MATSRPDTIMSTISEPPVMLTIASLDTGSPIKVLTDVRKVCCMAVSKASTVISKRMSTFRDGSMVCASVGTAVAVIRVSVAELS